MDFSLFYFANDSSGDTRDRYRLLIEGAKFADANGFAAVWTPERHFHPFGGLYPNPAVVGAAVAAVTDRIAIRAGSVVGPLHNPIRIAEEWSVVDNLSDGRVGISFASGWNSGDFVLAPDAYQQRRTLNLEVLDQVRDLWRGKTTSAREGSGQVIDVRIYPAPIQAELPVWVTAAGDVETFRGAGRAGAGVLTHLWQQDLAELAEKIGEYRAALRSRPDDDGWAGHVTLMLHCALGADTDAVRELVRPPMLEWLRSSFHLVAQAAARAFPDFDLKKAKPAHVEFLVNRSFDRYFDTLGLFGTVERARETVDAVRAVGVDEVAGLIDFGLTTDQVLTGLTYLDELRRTYAEEASQ